VKALVFGAGGQVGRALMETAPRGCEIRAFDRASCDIAEPGAAEHLIREARPDLVINAAAYTAVDRAESEPDLAEAVNAVAPDRIAAASAAVGARQVFISTDFIFDGSSSRPYRPDDPPAPLGVYGRTKLAGESAVRAADPQALIVRTAWVHAATGANFVNTMLRLMRDRDTVSVVADQVGTPTYARSLASAIWTLAEANAAGTYHFTDAGVASWYDFAVAIFEEGRAAGLLERPVSVIPISTADYPTAARRPAFSVLDKSATWPLLGGPAPHWRANLREALKELRDNG
jgi:dTDP-4-dehydrorhamnose reductase